MKHFVIWLMICGGAILFCPIRSAAESFTLSYSLVLSGQRDPTGSRTLKRPLVVDLVGHTLTVPSQVIGYMLTLVGGDGAIYSFDVIDTTCKIPQEMSGSYELTITDGSNKYQGIIIVSN